MKHQTFFGIAAFLSAMLLFSPALLAAKGKKSRSDDKVSKREIKIKPGRLESRSELKDNVKYYGDAYYIKGIPMIDQGDRPLCAIVTVKRIVDYYNGGNSGVPVKVLGRAMRYDKSRGTNTADLVKAIQQYSPELKLNCAVVYTAFPSYSSFSEFCRKYNAQAGERSQIELSREEYLTYGLTPAIKTIDYRIFRKVRTDDPQRRDLLKQVTRTVKQGIPVFWTVNLGLYKESGVKFPAGGHARLIIGFNEKSNEIIYSDSWGSAHARKSMPWNDAFAITTGMLVLSPRR